MFTTTYTDTNNLKATIIQAKTKDDLDKIHSANPILIKVHAVNEAWRNQLIKIAGRIPASCSQGNDDYSLNAGQDGI